MIGNQHVWTGAAAGFAAAALLFLVAPNLSGPGRLPPVADTPLLASGESVVGERIVYPTAAPAKVTAAIVTLAPGQETGWHTHGVPTLGYVIEGELTVDYGERRVRRYRAGEAMLEAISTPHNGRNTGKGSARILAVFMGADGLKTSEPVRR